MKQKFCLMLAATLLLAVSCETGNGDETRSEKPAEPIVLSAVQSQKVAADNAFAFDLFRQVIATADDNKNALISPLSATMALGMLYNGTSPDAGAEMAAALGMADLQPEQINEYYRTMREALLEIDPQTELGIANSIWSREGYGVKKRFIDLNCDYYDAHVESRDFNLPATLKAINNWCAGKTCNKITKIVDRIPAEAMMYLINAVYFKGVWQCEFDKNNTRQGNFAMAGGKAKNVPMMNQTARFPYCEDASMQCLEMPYGNGAFSMVVMLPVQGKSVDELIAELDADSYNAMLARLAEREVMVKLPRWRQECNFSLNDPLSNLGMRRIFCSGGNLNGIADDSRLCVSGVQQKSFIEVNEQGTEAAAVTVVEVGVTSVPSYPRFLADRPFVYLIREKSTGVILFIGRMDEPAN